VKRQNEKNPTHHGCGGTATSLLMLIGAAELLLVSNDILLKKSLELRLGVATTEGADIVHSDCYVLRNGSPQQVFGVPNLRGSIYRGLLAKPSPMFQGMLIRARFS
jgi:hypothetical protein